MHKLYEKVGSENLVYTDTDSIHTFKPLSDVGNELGQLSFKGKTDGNARATYVRNKFYIFNDVLKCKGLQYILTAKDMRKLIALNDVSVISTFYLKIRSAFRRHEQILKETQMVKHFSLEEDLKRVYEKSLIGEQLLRDYCRSKPVYVYGLV
jgi:hypothetical protein